MAEIARIFRFDDQPPLVQLIFSFCIVIVAGTIFFWLFIMAGSLFFGIAPGRMVLLPGSYPDAKGGVILKYIQFSQQVGLFLLPTLIVTHLIRTSNESYLKLDRYPSVIKIIAVVFLAMILIPVLNYTGVLNSRMVLPEDLSAIQRWITAKEYQASRLTEILITSPGVLTLALNVFILAVVPAFCEEFLFRGLLQQLMKKVLRSSHAGIWMTAIIFSSIHFQFLGFLPRLILGLVFGYLFYWTGSLWYSVIAHFVNNIIPVVYAYFNGWRAVSEQVSASPETPGDFPFYAVILSGLILFYFWRESRSISVEEVESSPGDKSAEA